MEIYNFSDDCRDSTWFNHLLLGGEISELVKEDSFDPKNLKVELKINGYDVRIEDFNKILKDWGSRIEEQIKANRGYLESDQAVKDKAEELIKTKLGNIQDALQSIEDSLWKLED